MKYLKRFEQNSAYETFKSGSDFILPNVSYVEDINVVYYNAYDPSTQPIYLNVYAADAMWDESITIIHYPEVYNNLCKITTYANTTFGGEENFFYGSITIDVQAGTAKFGDAIVDLSVIDSELPAFLLRVYINDEDGNNACPLTTIWVFDDSQDVFRCYDTNRETEVLISKNGSTGEGGFVFTY